MTLEDLLNANTAALIENTAALRQCIAATGGSPAPIAALPDPAPAAKAAKAPKTAKTEPVVAEEPEPEQELKSEPEAPAEAPADNDAPATADQLKPIRDTYSAKSKEATDLAAFKDGFAKLRSKFKIEKITDLVNSQVATFLAGIEAL